MLLWIVFSVMAGIAVLAIVVPLARGKRAVATHTEGDIAVYRDQLAALDEEVARGVINASEAEAARSEISRRLLAAGERRQQEATPRFAPAGRYFPAALMLGIVVIGVSTAGYLAVGSPELPGQPLAQRRALPPSEQDPEMLLAKVEDYLKVNPDDGKAWDLVAPVYLEVNRFEDAARAYANAVRLLGEDPKRLTGLGQSLAHAAGGAVTPAAQDAFERALKLDSSLVAPRFYLALALEQEGSLKEAADAWHKLLAIAPADAPWRPVAEQRLAALVGGAGEQAPATTNAPPENAAMVEQMVARLAERLKTDGGDPDGWVMLMRSYKVLGREAEAQETLARARERFADDGAALKTIEQAAAALGLNDAGGQSGGPT